MNPRVTIGFLVVLAVLGGVVYFTELRNSPATPSTSPPGAPAAPKEKEDPNLTMFTIDEKEIVRVEYLTGAGRTTVTKDGDDWRLQPSGELAERFRVNSLMARLTQLKANRYIAEPGDSLAVYGLVSPEMVVRMWRQDDTLYELIVGGKTPNDAGTYAKRPDSNAIYVIPNTIATDIEKMVSEPPVVPPTPTPRPTDPVTPTPLVPDATSTPVP
jgi:hypothetical protein